jgi:hypothetical protein
MCMQCAAGAAAALGSASGIRAWLAYRSPRWFTPRVAKAVTASLLVSGLIAAGLIGG